MCNKCGSHYIICSVHSTCHGSVTDTTPTPTFIPDASCYTTCSAELVSTGDKTCASSSLVVSNLLFRYKLNKTMKKTTFFSITKSNKYYIIQILYNKLAKFDV